MIKGKLTRIQSVHKNLRTDTVEGTAEFNPTVGKSFSITAPPLNPEALVRLVETTEVLEVKQNGSRILFSTLNSDYIWEINQNAS